ncbi:MAG: hypothetical protein CEO21_251 [Microgenomates group bacterium Gr01-1014_80]|nr:MAG: hypothetical protein CEO21_251 [Microgenomates group bacterium Gr01-1014_80]
MTFELNTMNIHHINKIQILLSLILLGGLAALVYLSQQTQIFKSKATQTYFNAFEVTDTSGTPLEVINTGNFRIYKTDSLDVKIKIQDINALVTP